MNTTTRSNSWLLLGLGNIHRRDDGAGIYVTRELLGRGLVGADIRMLSGEATEILNAWAGASRVVIVDAVDSGKAPGTIHRIAVGGDPLPKLPGTQSTHGLGLAEAIELGSVLGQLPRELVILGIEGNDFTRGEGLTECVQSTADLLIQHVLDSQGDLSCTSILS